MATDGATVQRLTDQDGRKRLSHKKRQWVFLPRLIEELQAIAPHYRLRTPQLPTEHIANSLERGDTDLAIGSHCIQDPNLFQQELFMHHSAP